MPCKNAKISFEIEGYLFRNGSVYVLSESELHKFEFASEGGKKFHPVRNYMIEGKTYPVTDDIDKSAESAVVNIRTGLDVVRRISGKKDIEVLCDSKLFDSLPFANNREDVGTHVHVDYSAIAEFFGLNQCRNVYPGSVVWLMRQSCRRFAEEYCYSDRLRRRVSNASVFSDFSVLEFPSIIHRQTINYRGKTIEVVIPDSTDRILVLKKLGRDVRKCAIESAEFLCQSPDYKPPCSENERIGLMNRILEGFLDK